MAKISVDTDEPLWKMLGFNSQEQFNEYRESSGCHPLFRKQLNELGLEPYVERLKVVEAKIDALAMLFDRMVDLVETLTKGEL